MPSYHGSPFTHRVRLHFRSISRTEQPFHTLLEHTQAVYAPYGIKIEMASGQSVKLSDDETGKYRRVDGQCTWNPSGTELGELQAKLGQRFDPFAVTVIYVEQLDTLDTMGCAGHHPSLPACLISRYASQWDTAHEVGHVLLTRKYSPLHSFDRLNLMAAGSRSFGPLPVLTQRQVDQMKKSPCCVPITSSRRAV